MLAAVPPSPDRSSPRDRTREDIYQLIRESSDLTRSGLVELTGLPSSTVGHAVSRLLADGRITESTARAKGPGSGSGRPAAVLNVVSTGAPTGAIDFGHQHVSVALGDSLGNLVEEVTIQLNVDEVSDQGVDIACHHLLDMQRRHQAERFRCIVMGVPAPIDAKTGLVRQSTVLSSWVGKSPARELARRLGVPVRIDNDAALGAFGELYRGAGQQHRDFIYIKASHGVGAGLVINGEPYRGGTGLAGEVGHTTIAGRTELCRCGSRGCLETVVSVPSVKAQIAHTHPNLLAEAIDLGELDDPVSARILNEAGRTLGIVAADLCNLLNPTAVIIGGELGASGPALIEGVRSSVGRFAQPAIAGMVEVLPAALGHRAEIIGALQLAARHQPA